MVIYYIRHADPIYNPDSLTPLGKRQAEAVAKRLSLHGIDEIYSSPSNRAMQTAEPLSEILKKPITTLDWCDEGLCWGEFTVADPNGNRNWMFWNDSVRDRFVEKEVLDLRDRWYQDPFFDEKVGKGVNRVNCALDEFLKGFGYIHDRVRGVYKVEKETNKRIAVFAHQGFGMIFFSSLLDIPYPVFSTRFDISHSCVSLINFPNSHRDVIVPKLLQHSNDSHLYKEGLPTKYNNGFTI